MTVSLIAILGLLIFSPYALAKVAHVRTDWSQLSKIAQTYGAASAILSSLALVGVVVSLLYQARDSRNALEQTTRTLQFELIKMELEDPSLMTIMGAPWDLDMPSESTAIREHLYVQMWVSYTSGNYVNGGLSEPTVRRFAEHELFRSRAGRNYWVAVGQLQLGHSKGRLNHFFRLLDDEYRKAVSNDVPVASPVTVSEASVRYQPSPATRTDPVQQLCVVIGAAVVGGLAGRYLHRRKG